MRFCGEVGYGESTETAPGVWEDVITDVKTYRGDVNRLVKRDVPAETLNDNLVVNNEINVLADEFAYSNFSKIKYVEWLGVRWNVTAVRVQQPRLILNIGDVYNGPTP